MGFLETLKTYANKPISTVVLIVSKTRMSNGVCVGGIIEITGEFIRLHNEHGGNLQFDAPYEIGDRWLLKVEKAWNSRPNPHSEDKQVKPINKIKNVGIRGIINYLETHQLGNRFIKGSLDNAFEGYLNLSTSKNYINRCHIPSFSTQFWIADCDLIHIEQWNSHYYRYKDGIRIKYVGTQTLIDRIPRGSIIRLSLANWWDGDGSGEERCYLQLSGWYIS